MKDRGDREEDRERERGGEREERERGGEYERENGTNGEAAAKGKSWLSNTQFYNSTVY